MPKKFIDVSPENEEDMMVLERGQFKLDICLEKLQIFESYGQPTLSYEQYQHKKNLDMM